MISIYKPTKAGNGSTCSFYLSRDEKPSVMVSLLRQDGWNSKTKAPIFASNRGKQGANIVIKLDPPELCGIIHSINSSEDWKAYHDAPSSPNTNSIKFGLYKDRETGEPKGGFNFGVLQINKETKEKGSILISLNTEEALLLKTYFVFCLNKQFETSFDTFKSKESKGSWSQEAKSQKKVKEEPVSDDFDLNTGEPELSMQENEELW